MARLKEIFDRFFDEIRDNVLSGKVVSNKNKIDERQNDKTKIFPGQNLILCSVLGNQIVFDSGNGDKIRVYLHDIEIAHDISIIYPNFSRIYIVKSYDNQNNIEIIFIDVKPSTIGETLDIGFGDSFLEKRYKSSNEKKEKIGQLPGVLYSELAFNAGPITYIFYILYNNSENDGQVKLFGANKSADINIVEGKWIISRETTKDFPRKIADLKNLRVSAFYHLNFKNESETMINAQIVQERISKGNAILSLWNKYKDHELELAIKFQKKFGKIFYKMIRHLSNGITRVRLVFNEEQESLFRDNIDTLLNKSFEIYDGQLVEVSKNKKRDSYKIKTIDRASFEAEIEDPKYRIIKDGIFVLSVQGEESVNNRRERVKNELVESNNLNPLLFDLKMAIEGQTEGLFYRDGKGPRKKILGIPESTKAFLKRMHIDKLNDKQIEAIEIAINTPDIAVIQGPPGTGKSTVIAVICHILSEIAEKNANRKEGNTKTFLLSAFQNDTVEHIASKVRVNGMPTIKVGKATQGIHSEDVYIDDLKEHIDKALAEIPASCNTDRISKRLANIKSKTDNNEIRSKISTILRYRPANSELMNRWKFLNLTANNKADAKNEELVQAFRSLRTNADSYADDGWAKIIRLIRLNPPITEEEKEMLNDAPDEEPDEEFLFKLTSFQEKYLHLFCSDDHQLTGSVDHDLYQWIDDAIEYYKSQEMEAYNDLDTFKVAVLEDIRAELEGSSKYVREGIKAYSESLAATNQIAAGYETYDYDSFENVILEEAARSNPLDLLIPTLRATERIIMVGDQKQLPQLLEPNVERLTLSEYEETSVREEMAKRIQESLFGIIYDNLEMLQETNSKAQKRVIMLNEQFRMHPEIGNFISRNFYKSTKEELRLRNSDSVTAESKAHGLSLMWAKGKACVTWDVPHSRGLEYSRKGKSRSVEVDTIIKILKEIDSDAVSYNLSIGVISFYRAQVDLLNEAAAKLGWVEKNEDGEYVTVKARSETEDHREKFRIGTVDSFQGKEFDIVIISTVRSNNIEQVPDNVRQVYGFLTLDNRINVAFSRAQRLIIAVGDKSMFINNYAKEYVPALYDYFTQY